MQHLCSRTLRPSLTESFVDAWTSSLEDSRANPSVLLESAKLLKTPDTSSPTSQTELESANLEFAFSKTWQESSLLRLETENQFSNMSSENWKAWVIEQRQEYSQRKKLAHLTSVSESSSLGWPTARTSDAEGGRIETEMTDEGFKSKRHKSNQTFGAKLRDAVETHEENWATPNICGNHNRKGASKTSGDGLSTQVKNWATPQTFDSNNLVRTPEKLAQTRAEKNAGCMNLREQVHYPDMDHSRKAAKNWPTATTRDWKDTNATVPPSRANPSKKTLGQRVAHVGLQDRANPNTNGKSQESWPTPVCPAPHDSNNTAMNGRIKRKQRDLGHATNGKLNPNWVEHLMGLPVGWTDLGSWETE